MKTIHRKYQELGNYLLSTTFVDDKAKTMMEKLHEQCPGIENQLPFTNNGFEMLLGYII